jgi:hypothetical protein
MKTFVLLVAAAGVWILAGYSYITRGITVPAPAHVSENYASIAHAPAIPRTVANDDFIQLGSNEVRKFDLTIDRIYGATVIASGCFYDIDPTVTTEPEKLGGAAGKWTQAGEFGLSGFPSYIVNGQHWVGWLVRDAVGSVDGRPIYDIAPEPEPKRLAAPAPGVWMNTNGGTLDQRPRHH